MIESLDEIPYSERYEMTETRGGFLVLLMRAGASKMRKKVFRLHSPIGVECQHEALKNAAQHYCALVTFG